MGRPLSTVIRSAEGGRYSLSPECETVTQPSDTKFSVSHQQRVARAGLVTVAVLAAVVTIVLAGRDGVVDALLAIPWWAVAGAVMLGVMSMLGEGAVLAMISGDPRPRTVLRMTQAYVAGNFVGAVTPYAVGGAPAWLWALTREKVPIEKAAALVAARSAVAATFFAGMTLVAALVLPGVAGLPPATVLVAVLPIVAVLLMIVATRNPARFSERLTTLLSRLGGHSGLRWLSKAADTAPAHIGRFAEAFSELRRHPGSMAGALVMFAVSRFSQLAAIPLLFGGAGAATSGTLFAGLISVWVISSIAPAPSGEGVAQAAVVEVFGPLVGSQPAAAAALGWRACVYYPMFLIGMVLFARLVRSPDVR